MLFGTYLLVDSVLSVVIILKILKSVKCVIFPHVLHTHDKAVRAPKRFIEISATSSFLPFIYRFQFVKTVDLPGDFAPWSLPLTYWERKRGSRTLVKLLCKPPMAIPG